MDRLQSAWRYLRDGGNQSAEDLNFRKRWVAPYGDFDNFVTRGLSEPDVLNNSNFRPQTDFLLDQHGNLETRIQICRFESLQEDLLRLPEGVLQESKLPHLNASRRDEVVADDATRLRVAEVYRVDLEMLGYRLD